MNTFVYKIKQMIVLLRRNSLRTILLIIGLILTSVAYSAGDIVTSNIVLSTSIKYQNFPTNAVLLKGYIEPKILKDFPQYDMNIKSTSFWTNPFPDSIELVNNEALPISIFYVANNFHLYPVLSADTSDSLESTALIAGRSFTPEDALLGRKVAVVHSALGQAMFNEENVIGKKVSILGKGDYEIVGVLKDTPDIHRVLNSFLCGEAVTFPIYLPNYNDFFNTTICLLPQTISHDYAEKLNNFISSKSSSASLIPYTAHQHKFLLNQNKEDAERALDVLLFVMCTISSIFIFALMLFFVKERVVEIGIRKAIGARAKDITFQFMFEMFFISLLSSMIGMVVGVFIGCLLAFFSTAAIGLPSVIIGIKSTILPVLVSVLISMVASLVPSIIASRKTIKECLHFD